MANRYGKGYYTDWYEMIASIEEGSKKAFKMACKRICAECNERIRGGIYSGQPTYYERSFEMAQMDDYLTADVIGLECQFRYNNEEFMKLSIANPEHHALSDDSGNGYDTQSFMDDIISPIHGEFMAEIRYYIQENFANIYRDCCREIGFNL